MSSKHGLSFVTSADPSHHWNHANHLGMNECMRLYVYIPSGNLT